VLQRFHAAAQTAAGLLEHRCLGYALTQQFTVATAVLLYCLLLHCCTQAEFAVLVNGTGHILAAPLCPELRGELWNPASIVSDTVASRQRYTRTGESQHYHICLYDVIIALHQH
jgi:hypothetical protein